MIALIALTACGSSAPTGHVWHADFFEHRAFVSLTPMIGSEWDAWIPPRAESTWIRPPATGDVCLMEAVDGCSRTLEARFRGTRTPGHQPLLPPDLCGVLPEGSGPRLEIFGDVVSAPSRGASDLVPAEWCGAGSVATGDPQHTEDVTWSQNGSEWRLDAVVVAGGTTHVGGTFWRGVPPPVEAWTMGRIIALGCAYEAIDPRDSWQEQRFAVLTEFLEAELVGRPSLSTFEDESSHDRHLPQGTELFDALVSASHRSNWWTCQAPG